MVYNYFKSIYSFAYEFAGLTPKCALCNKDYFELDSRADREFEDGENCSVICPALGCT